MGAWVVALLQAFEVAKVGVEIWELVDGVSKDGMTPDERAQVEAIIARAKASLHDTSRDV